VGKHAKHYFGGVVGADPLVSSAPRTSGVFSLGALGGDGAATSDDLNWSDVVLLLDGSSTTDLSSASPTVTFTSSGISAGNSGGKYGQYIDLQDSGYITVGLGQNIGANGDPFTVETWARFDSQSDEGIFNLTTTGSFNNASNSISIGTNGTSWNIYHDGGASQQVSPGPSNATWYHVAVVFDGTNLVYYVGGSAILTKSNHSANIPAAGYSTVMIGGYFSTSYVMNGRIEDFRVTDGVARYNGPFTPPQEALPQATAATTRPTRRWGGMTGRSLVESTAGTGDANWSDVTLLLRGDNSTLEDISGSNHTSNLSWTGTATYATGKYGGAFDLSASSRYLNGPTTTQTSDFAFGTGDFTIETWVYLPSSGLYTGDKCLFETRGGGTGGWVWFFTGTGTGTGSGIVQRYFLGGSIVSATSNNLSTDTWHHVALVRSGSNITFYRDGLASGGASNVGSVDFSQGTGNGWRIGIRSDGNEPLTGLVDDFRITKSVARDIAADWTAGVYTSALPQGAAVAASTNVPTTGVLSLAEDYQGKL